MENSLAHANEILEQALTEFGADCLVTSALGAGGVLLLTWIHEINPEHPCYLVDTGWLFKETLAYRDYLIAQFGFNLITVDPSISKQEMDNIHGYELYIHNPDMCCKLLKVDPVQKLLMGKKAWVSAPRREQGGSRADLAEIKVDDCGITRVYPLAQVTREEIDDELKRRRVLQHPLRAHGYESIGCIHCTIPTKGGERSGRWARCGKTECGLHFKPEESS